MAFSARACSSGRSMFSLAKSTSPSSLVRPAVGGSIRQFSGTSRAQFARISLVGNVGADPEVKTMATGGDLLKLVVGSNYGPITNRRTDWWQVSSFETPGPRKDALMRIKKGSKVYIDGELRMRSYEDEHGKRHNSVFVVPRYVEVIRKVSRPEDGSMGGEEGDPASTLPNEEGVLGSEEEHLGQ